MSFSAQPSCWQSEYTADEDNAVLVVAQEIESGLDSILAIIRLIGSKGELVTYLQGGKHAAEHQ